MGTDLKLKDVKSTKALDKIRTKKIIFVDKNVKTPRNISISVKTMEFYEFSDNNLKKPY